MTLPFHSFFSDVARFVVLEVGHDMRKLMQMFSPSPVGLKGRKASTSSSSSPPSWTSTGTFVAPAPTMDAHVVHNRLPVPANKKSDVAALFKKR